MPAHDHYSHILKPEGNDGVIALGCNKCRTAVFYKHVESAMAAVLYHKTVCPGSEPIVAELVTPREFLP
jgi:hypothetical protein